ncbi:TPR protein [Geosmithia morbida]|uniref:TPR protein n=1 Tax=Geosmithia morbida TaxID=1094350 RepID=A0A9P4YRG0_9HYPO|nr:TPR protein [Geosmithia morbida]KAF4119669.1 TPR protein [Geosmithia morbida]
MSKFSTESSSEFEAIGGAISSWTQEAYDIIGGRWSQELKDWNGWTQQNIDEMRIVSQMLLRMASGIATPPRASRRQHIPTDDHRTQNLPLEVTGPSGEPGEIQAYQGSVENPAPAPGSTMELDNPAYHQRNLRVLDQSISKSVSVDLLTSHQHGIGKGNGTPTRLRICVLHGLPGIGKTNTAIEFAYRYRKHFTHIFWVSSDTEDKFEHDLCDVKWLLVLDNMDEARILNPLWVDLHQGSIIITSRGQVSSLHRLDCVERHFQLNELSPEEGTQLTQKLLNGRIEGLDPHAAADLAKRSQYYPLLIEQVTSFIGCSYSTMAEFTEEVGRGSTDRDLQHIHLDNPWSSGSVLDAIASHMHTLGSNNPMAVEILATIAFFDPDSIPEGMLYYPSGPVPILSSTISIKSLLGELSRRSFIARLPASEGRGASINMHRLVRDIVMHSTVPLQRPFEYAVALLRQSFPLQGMARDHMVEHWGRCEIFQPHVLSLHCHYLESQAHRDGEKVLRPSSDFVDLIYSCACTLASGLGGSRLHDSEKFFLNRCVPRYLCERGQFNLGKSLVSSICDDCGKLYGTIHAAPKTLLADIYTVQLFYHNEVRHGMNLVELAKKALSLRESAVSEDLMKKYHPNRANGFMNVGVILAAESPRDAILYHKKALEIRLGSEEFASEQTLGLALNYLNIGRCWWIVGELEEAAGCLNESVALFRQRESVAGKRFSLSAMSLQSLGVVRADQGDLNSSLDLLSESLKLYIATLGGRHLKTLSCCYRFGWLWKLLRQFDLAEKHLQDCIDLYTSMMEGENPPRAELARSMYQLSRVLEEKNGFDSRCAELREDSCKLLEEVLSKQGNKSSARVEFTEADFDDAILYFYR